MLYGMIELVCGSAVILVLLYYFFTMNYTFWEKRGVKGPKPTPPFGNFGDVFRGKISAGDYMKVLYDQYKDEPMVGFFMRREPVLLLRDLDLIKDVLIKDFQSFPERDILLCEKAEPLGAHLFRIEGERWRPLRHRFSPVFTSGKLKEMFHLILECGEQFERYLEDAAQQNEPIECREIAARYTTDVIGSCGFGIEINAIEDEDCKFREMGKRIFRSDWKLVMRTLLREGMPWLHRWIGILFTDRELDHFFTQITNESIRHRKENKIRRHDFIDVLVELKDNPGKLGAKELTDEFIAAQALVFFAAGFETSSTVLSNAMYELALNPDKQEKLRREIKEAVESNDGLITYDLIKKMKYLDMFFKESLRKYPSLVYLARKCQTDYTFRGTKVTIHKGQKVYIPVYGIQRDPNYYPNPEVFDPERFSEENVEGRPPMANLPFGDGPRNCVGARFAVNQVKIGLIKTLLNYKLEVCEKTMIPYVNKPVVFFLLQPNDGIYLKISKIDRT